MDESNIHYGAYPNYSPSDPPETRIAKCIYFELSHGGNELAAARAILRDIERGFIRLPNPRVDLAGASPAQAQRAVGQTESQETK